MELKYFKLIAYTVLTGLVVLSCFGMAMYVAIGLCVVLLIALSTIQDSDIKKKKEENVLQLHKIVDNVKKIEILEYTEDDRIIITTYEEDRRFLTGFRKVK